MTGRLEIVTPLGVAAVRIACGGASSAETAGSSRSLGVTTSWWWENLGGLAVEIIVTPYPAIAGQCWGFVWTLTALQDSPDAHIQVQHVGPVEGDPYPDEDLVALEFEADGHVVCVGGPDEMALENEAGDLDLPASWRWPRPDGSTGLKLRVNSRTIDWWLPGLLAGESVQHHIAVAWAPSGGTPELDDPALLAVDAATTFILGPMLEHDDPTVAPWLAILERTRE